MNAEAPPSPTLIPPDTHSPASPFERRDVLRAAVDLAAPNEFIAYLTDCAEKRVGRSVVGISAPYASAMARDAQLREAFLKADVLIPDGQGFVWGARALGVPCGDRIAIPDVCERLLEAGGARKWKVFVYGATAEMNAAAVQNIRARFPNLSAVEGQHGYDQNDATETALIAKLRDEKFNLLIVARPSPEKEIFLARCCHEAGVVGLAAGGYADVLAGAKTRAPRFVQAIGMEWFFRLIQDPAKLWKRIGWANAKFAASVAWNVFLGVPRRPWFAQPALHVVALVAVVLLAYFRSLNAPYHFDDPEYILHNSAIRSFDTLNQITVTAHRKLWWLSNAICYKLSEYFGGHSPENPEKPDVRFFRAWNIACHLIAVFALYGLLRRCLKAKKRTGDVAGATDLRPFAAAAIFAAHPLCTEAVTYISGRDNGMGGMFYLLGLYFAAITFEKLTPVLQASRLPESRLAGETPAAQKWPAWFWPSFFMLLAGACSVLTKESYLTFPAAVALVYFCFYRSASAPKISLGLVLGIVLALAAMCWGAAGRNDGCLWIAMPLTLFALIAGGLLGGVPPINGSAAPPRSNVKMFFQTRVGVGWAFLIVMIGLGAAAVLASPYVYSRTIGALTGYQGSSYVRSLCSQAYAVPAMLWRAIAPVSVTFSPDFNITHNLNIDHQFPTISDPFDARTLLGAAIVLGLTIFGIFGAFRGWLGSFGVLLALISIASTNTIFERGDIVSERNFYLAAAGGACLLAWLAGGIGLAIARKVEASEDPKADELEKQAIIRRETGLWTIVLGCCIVGPFVAFTTLRNYDWGDPYRLWKVAMERSPDKLRALYNFGVSAQAANRLDEAQSAFERAIAIGEEMSKRGEFRPDEAVDIKCFHLAYSELANVNLTRYVRGNKEDYRALGEIKKIYDKGLNRTAYDPDLALTYANFLVQSGQASEATPMLQQSLNLHTWADHLYLPLGVAQLESGNVPAAAQYLESALRMKDEHSLGYVRDIAPKYRSQVLALLGVARARMKKPIEAKDAFRESMRLVPDSVWDVLNYTAAIDFKLPAENTETPLLNSLSRVREEVLTAMRDAATEALATPAPALFPKLVRNKQALDYEFNRREAHRKKRRELGLPDDPETK